METQETKLPLEVAFEVFAMLRRDGHPYEICVIHATNEFLNAVERLMEEEHEH